VLMPNVNPIDDMKPVRKRPAWVIALCGILVILLIAVLAFVGLVFREFRKEVPVPSNQYSAAKLLVLNDPTPSHGPGEQPSSTQSPSGLSTPTTSLAQTGNTSGSLRFKPFIPESADIQSDLKAKASEINKLFDEVNRRVEEYERTKSSLEPEEAVRILNQIAKERQSASAEISRATNGRLTGDTHQALSDRSREFSRWFSAAGMEAYARCRMWGTTGSFAEGYLEDQRHEWIQQQLTRKNGQPVYLSDFNRATGYQDYNRALYYYRQQGGMNGFMNTLNLYYKRKHQEFADHF